MLIVYTFKNIWRWAYGKYYIGVCMVISQLLVNFIPDHATKHQHFINCRKTVHLFLEYGELPALPILQITFNFEMFISQIISMIIWDFYSIILSRSFTVNLSCPGMMQRIENRMKRGERRGESPVADSTPPSHSRVVCVSSPMLFTNTVLFTNPPLLKIMCY